jgi:hypothetical protein
VDRPIGAEESEVGPQTVLAIAGRVTFVLVVVVLGGSFALSKLLTLFNYR